MKRNQRGQASVIVVIIIIILLVAACAGLGYIIINKNNNKTNVEVPTNKIAEEVDAFKVNLNTVDLSKFGNISKEQIKVISKDIIQITDNKGNVAVYNSKLDTLLDGYEAEYGTENLVVVSKDKSYGVIDTTGKEILKTTYHGINVYSDNVIAAQVVVNSQVLFGIFDGKGNQVLPCEYSSLKYYSDDLILLGNSDGYLVVDAKGTTKLKISDADYFNIDIVNDDTLIAMDNQKFKYGLLDLNKKVLIDFTYDRMEKLTSKYVKAEQNGLWGVMDLDGNVVIPFKYKWAMDISVYGNLFKIEEDSKFIYYNKKGNEVYETQDAELQIITDGKYLVTEKEAANADNNEINNTTQDTQTVNKYSVIDNDGGFIDNISGADAVNANGKDLIVYEANNKFGLIDSLLNEITSNIYKDIIVNEYCCIVENKAGTSYGIISKKGEELVSEEYSAAEYIGNKSDYEMILLQKDGVWQLVTVEKVNS